MTHAVSLQSPLGSFTENEYLRVNRGREEESDDGRISDSYQFKSK